MRCSNHFGLRGGKSERRLHLCTTIFMMASAMVRLSMNSDGTAKGYMSIYVYNV